MPGLPRLVQHAARPTAQVQDGVGGHQQVAVEGVAGIPRWIPRVQQVIQGSGVSVGIHRHSIHDQSTAANRIPQDKANVAGYGTSRGVPDARFVTAVPSASLLWLAVLQPLQAHERPVVYSDEQRRG